jgi:hypothetical protein
MDSNTETKVISFLDRRRKICDECEHLTTWVGIKGCEVCGCAIWGKTMLRGQSCPKGKWGPEE